MSDHEPLKEHLADHGWPTGLRNALIAGLISTPSRFFICDDSGSMMSNDGHRLVGSGAQAKVTNCTRWIELVETLKFHVSTAAIGCAPTEFRMLNGAPPITIGSPSTEDGISILRGIFEAYPGGGTPLCRHVNEVAKQIIPLASNLRATCKKAALVIFTDGEASDGDIAEALKPLHDLPVWVVIRLCTEEAGIVSYWTNIDKQLELNMDVLDDPIGESREIVKYNNWLTYGAPLHRLREFGVIAREFDMLDETMLSADQMVKFCAFIFGVKAQELPHPDVNFNEFRDQISAMNDKEPLVWSPVTKAPAKWIDIAQLTALYGPKIEPEAPKPAAEPAPVVAPAVPDYSFSEGAAAKDKSKWFG